MITLFRRSLIPILQKMVKIGTPKQAKYGVRCISKVCKNSAEIFKQIFIVSITQTHYLLGDYPVVYQY